MNAKLNTSIKVSDAITHIFGLTHESIAAESHLTEGRRILLRLKDAGFIQLGLSHLSINNRIKDVQHSCFAPLSDERQIYFFSPKKKHKGKPPSSPPSVSKTYQVINSLEVIIRKRKPGLRFREVTSLQEIIHQRIHIINNFCAVGAHKLELNKGSLGV